ncbi:GNAT family N-acetyltransferase [Lacinutrix salivirga]
MDIFFKPIKSSDTPKVLHLFKSSAERIKKLNINHWHYWLNPPLEKIKWVEKGIQNNEFYFIQSTNEETIGMVRIMSEDELYWGKQENKALYIHSLVVTDTYNGKGFGSKIIKDIENRAKKDNCSFLRLDADSKNPKLCSYYKNLGFKKVGTKELPLSTYTLYEKALN